MGNDLSLYTSAQDDFAAMRQQDIIMPRVTLQQATSLGVVDGKYRMGQFIDLAQEAVAIDMGAIGSVVPLMYWLEWIEWNPDRSAPKEKKIIARSLDPQSDLAKQASMYVEIDTPQGKRLKVTEYYHFIVLIPSYSGNYKDPFMISFAKSSHRCGKQWLNKLIKAKIKIGDSLVKAPIWANQWELSSKKEQKGGNTFAFSVIGAAKMIPTDVHADVKELSDTMKARRAEVASKNTGHEEDTSAEHAASEHPADV